MKIPAPEDSDRLLTLEEFARLPEEDAYRLELVRGRVVREPRPMAPHARVNARVIYVLEAYAERSGRGVVYADMGFVLEEEPPTLRGPDAAFVSHERVPKSGTRGTSGTSDRTWPSRCSRRRTGTGKC